VTEPFNALLVGYGLIGPLWARLLGQHRRIRLAGVVDTSDDALRRAVDHLRTPDLVVTPSLDSAIRSCAPSVIVDASPPWNHARVAEAALAARCHLLSEKPMATDFPEAAARAERWRTSGLVYMVNQNYRWSPRVRELRQLIRQGTVGSLRGVYADYFQDFPKGTFRDHLPHAILADMAVHHFDLARFLTAQDAESVLCRESSNLTAVALFRLSGPAVFSYRASWEASGQDTGRCGVWRVVGNRGSVTFSTGTPTRVTTVGPGSLVSRRVLPPLSPEHTEDTALEYEFTKGLDHFVECLLTGAAPETSCDDNLQTVEMVSAAIRSAEEESEVALGGAPAPAPVRPGTESVTRTSSEPG
jgi:predicted dehydrogenase